MQRFGTLLKSILFLFATISAQLTYACTCNPLGPIEDTAQLSGYDFIALAYVTGVEELKRSPIDQWPDKAIITIEIMTLFKGASVHQLLDLTRNTGCYYNIMIGQEWIFFGIEENDTFKVHVCDHNEIHRQSDGEIISGFWGNLGTLEDLYDQEEEPTINGMETSYYRNGRKEREAEYIEGKLNGFVKYWHPNGVLERSTLFKNGRPIGSSKSYYSNGNLHYESFYNDSGKIEGKSFSYFIHGQLKSASTTKNGQSFGVYRTYFDTALKTDQIPFVMSEYFPNLDSSSHPWTRIQIDQEWVYDANGERIIWREYFPNGNMHKEEIEDVENDLTTNIYYYPNGKLSAIWYKKNGKNHGHYQGYNEDGTIGRGWDYD